MKNKKQMQGFHYTVEEDISVDQTSINIQQELDTARLREIRSKFITRIVLTTVFILLLFIQNSIVFAIVYQAFLLNKLSELQLIFSTLIGATLTETYFIIKIIVTYMFKDDDYTYKKSTIINS